MSDPNRTVRIAVAMLGYGERLPSEESIALLSEDANVARMRVLWSQPSAAVADLLARIEETTPKLEVEYSDSNLGSAGGYARLLQRFAADPGAPFLLLLDDDLRLTPNCISALLTAAQHHSEQLGSTLFLAYRPGLPEYRGLVEDLAPVRNPIPGCCIGFNVINLLTPARHSRSAPLASGLFSVGSAPWGGLFIPFKALVRLGMPREDFFLYADDSDVTLRFTRGEGNIFLVPDAIIHDTDEAWNAIAGNSSNLTRRMLLLPEIKVFHEVRNRSFIGRRYYPGNPVLYRINKALFLSYAYLIGITHGRVARSRLIHRAVNEGERMADEALRS